MTDLEREPQRAAAGMLCVGFDGVEPSADVLEMIDRGVGGVALFGRNVESPAQVQHLCAELKRRAGRPLLICVDHEGGRVQRMREGVTAIPPAREVGARGDPAYARRLGETMARELRAANIDLNLAPVLDVDTNPANPVIADRSFGPTPELVTRMGLAIIEGLQSNGVGACAKHFPGHGDTSTDSHFHLPRVDHPMSRLEQVELPPFKAAIRAGVACVMSAHVMLPAIDPHEPATMSRPAIDELLRGRLGFDGVVISDDLEMKAIADHFGVNRAVVRGAQAGVDLFLVCGDTPELQRGALEALTQAIRSGEVSPARVEQSHARLARFADQYVRPAS